MMKLWMLCLLAAPAFAVTITLTESIPNFALNFQTVPGTVLLCEGETGVMNNFEICVDTNGDFEVPSDSVTFSPGPNNTTLGMFCSDFDNPEDAGDACPPHAFGDNAIGFENPPLPGMGEVTEYAPVANEPGANNVGVDYELVSDQPIPEPSTWITMASALLLIFRRVAISR